MNIHGLIWSSIFLLTKGIYLTAAMAVITFFLGFTNLQNVDEYHALIIIAIWLFVFWEAWSGYFTLTLNRLRGEE